MYSRFDKLTVNEDIRLIHPILGISGMQKTHGFLGVLGRMLVKSDGLQESVGAQRLTYSFR